MENISPAVSPVIINIPVIENSTSIFTKIFDYKYSILLIIIIIISILFYFYFYKPKYKLNSQTLKQPILQDFIVADINGKVIKISGEQVGEIKVPQQIQQQIPQQIPQQIQQQIKQQKVINQKIPTNFEEESSDENNNTKQHDLTNSEIRDITNKLKN